MHIDKFLYDVKTPKFQPGPFSVRLKYELKKVMFDKKSNKQLHLIYITSICCLAFICLMLVISPNSAQNINNIVFKNKTNNFDMILNAENNINLSNIPANMNSLEATLPFEENKSYLVHKYINKDGQPLIYVNEIKRSNPY
jgi:hypothetical protein